MRNPKPPAPCQKHLKWLLANLGDRCLAPLTSHDRVALDASVHIAELWGRSDAANRAQSATAYALVVSQMQEHTRELAFHCIAMMLDWSHRAELWTEAAMPPIENPRQCEFGPKMQRSLL